MKPILEKLRADSDQDVQFYSLEAQERKYIEKYISIYMYTGRRFTSRHWQSFWLTYYRCNQDDQF